MVVRRTAIRFLQAKRYLPRSVLTGRYQPDRIRYSSAPVVLPLPEYRKVPGQMGITAALPIAITY